MHHFSIAKREWERTIFIIALLGLIITGLLVAAVSLKLFKNQKQMNIHTKQLQPIYENGAFAFIQPGTPNVRTNAFHQGEQKIITRIQNTDNTDRQNRDKDREQFTHQDEIKDREEVVTVKEKPVNHYLQYLGYMETTNGELRAWLKSESIQGDKRLTNQLHISEEGETIQDYVVTSFNESHVILQLKGGKVLKINKGDRVNLR